MLEFILECMALAVQVTIGFACGLIVCFILLMILSFCAKYYLYVKGNSQ